MDMADVYDFGLRLQQARKNRKLSQAQVAGKIEVHTATVSAYENNVTTPSVNILSELALLYNVSVDYLLGHDNMDEALVRGLTSEQAEIVSGLVLHFRHSNKG